MDHFAVDRSEPGDSLAQFRSAVLANTQLQQKLQDVDTTELFVRTALSEASALGFSIEAEDLQKALRGDSPGLSRFPDAPLTPDTPQQSWLPVQIADGSCYGPCVEWAYFGADELTEPFFEDSVRKALRRPINRFVRHRTLLRELASSTRSNPSLQPTGIIFHMSRCGSTLVSQMLAQDRRNVVISEAPPLDAIVRDETIAHSAEEQVALLAAMFRALGQRRASHQERYFIKLDSWHILQLPLFRRALPHVPWIFLFREPVEVLASQIVQRGIHTVTDYFPPSFFGLSEGDAVSPHDYCALVLRQICQAALNHYPLGKGMMINYRQLPHAMWTKILPHFGIECDEEERRRMARNAQFDSKSPTMRFDGDSLSKRLVMTKELMAIANKRLGMPMQNSIICRLLIVLKGWNEGRALRSRFKRGHHGLWSLVPRHVRLRQIIRCQGEIWAVDVCPAYQRERLMENENKEEQQASAKRAWIAPKVIVSDQAVSDTANNVGGGGDGGAVGISSS